MNDLRRVHDRLERTADAAEQDKQRLAVSSLSAQQLRAAEVRAKIGGVGGYAPGKGGPDGTMATFSVNIHLGNGTVDRISTVIAGPIFRTSRGKPAVSSIVDGLTFKYTSTLRAVGFNL